MEGPIVAGWYNHANLGLIKIFPKNGQWVYICYTRNAQKILSRPKPVDPWVWALSEKKEHLHDVEES